MHPNSFLEHSLYSFSRWGLELNDSRKTELQYLGTELTLDVDRNELLKNISIPIKHLGYSYGEFNSPIESLNHRLVNCEGFVFLYALIYNGMKDIHDGLDNILRLETYHTHDSLKSHVNISDDLYSKKVWETTLDELNKFICPEDIYKLGFTKHKSRLFQESFSIIDSFVIQDLKKNNRNIDIVSYIDELDLGLDKYPQNSFYLKEKYSALNKAFASKLLTARDFYYKEEKCLRNLLIIDADSPEIRFNLANNIFNQVDIYKDKSLQLITIKLEDLLEILDDMKIVSLLDKERLSQLKDFFKIHTLFTLYILNTQEKYKNTCLKEIDRVLGAGNANAVSILTKLESNKKALS